MALKDVGSQCKKVSVVEDVGGRVVESIFKKKILNDVLSALIAFLRSQSWNDKELNQK